MKLKGLLLLLIIILLFGTFVILQQYKIQEKNNIIAKLNTDLYDCKSTLREVYWDSTLTVTMYDKKESD